jgi:hypothetical protein
VTCCVEPPGFKKESHLKDLTIELKNEPGALAEMGDLLGRAGVRLRSTSIGTG